MRLSQRAGRQIRLKIRFLISKDFVLDRIFPLIFGLEHEAVGALNQFIHRCRRMEINGRSDTQGYGPSLLAQGIDQSGVKSLNPLGDYLLSSFGHQNDEFIPPQAGYKISGASVTLKSGGQ